MKWKCPWAMRCWGGCCTQKWGAPGLVLRLGKKPSRFLLVAHNQLTNISLVPLADKKQHRELPKGDILFMENPSVEGKLGMKVHVQTFFLGEQFSKLRSCWSRLGCENPQKERVGRDAGKLSAIQLHIRSWNFGDTEQNSGLYIFCLLTVEAGSNMYFPWCF